MPNPRVFGYRDPLEGSPIKDLREAIEKGNSPLYKQMDLKNSQASSSEGRDDADEPASTNLGSEYKREQFREQILKRATEEVKKPLEQDQQRELPLSSSNDRSLPSDSHPDAKAESTDTIPQVDLLTQQPRLKQLRSEGAVSAKGSYRAPDLSSGRRARNLSPIKMEHLTNLPVQPRTAEVINSVAEILGYTELHPEVVAKIVDISRRVDA